MKSAKWILPLLLLVGCGAPTDNHSVDTYNYGYGVTHAVSDSNGVRIRWQTTAKPSDNTVFVAWRELVACTGLPQPNGPLVIVVDATDRNLNDPSGVGATFLDTDTILVAGWAPTESIKHSMLHILLKHSGFGDAENMSHTYHSNYGHCL